MTDVTAWHQGALHIGYELVADGQTCSACGNRIPPRRHPDFVLNTEAGRYVCMSCARSSHEGHYDAVNLLQHVQEAFANLLPEPSEVGPAWDYLRSVAQGAELLLRHEQF